MPLVDEATRSQDDLDLTILNEDAGEVGMPEIRR
jgi:hypothetical protein